MSALKLFIDGLKRHLGENKSNYVEHNSWLGDTESGFYSADEFDFDALLKEIDKFSESFKDQP